MGDFIDKEFKQINISDFKTILDNIDRKIYICDKKKQRASLC